MAERKRQNFDVDPEQAAELEAARQCLKSPSIKDAVLRSSRIIMLIARELRSGSYLATIDPLGRTTRIAVPELEQAGENAWKYLAPRPNSRSQLFFVKGTRIQAATLYFNMLANHETPKQAAENYDLPVEVMHEVIRYCESHKEEIEAEDCEVERQLREAGLLKGA